MSARLVFLCVLAVACVEQKPPVDYGDSTSLNTPTTTNGITAYIVTPRITDVLETSQLQLVVAAWTDPEPQPLRVTASFGNGSSTLLAAQSVDGPDQRYATSLSLLHGLNNLRIRISTLDGSRIRHVDYGLVYAADAPGLRMTLLAADDGVEPCGGVPVAHGVTNADRVCVRGHVTTKDGPATAMAVAVTSATGNVSVVTGADGAFEAALPLVANAAETIEATAGATTATSVIVQDSTPPQLVVQGAGAPIVTDASSTVLEGMATDELGLASQRLESGFGGVHALGSASAWSVSVNLVNGANAFTAVARDLAGNEATVPFTVVRNRVITLRAPTPNAGGTDLVLDKAALVSLLPSTADQQAIEMVRVPLRPAIIAALRAIRDPVASGLDTSAWGAAEWNLWKLLNMTPDNADLRGTSVEKLLALADAVGIPKARVLADVFDIDVLTTFVDESFLADVLLDQLVASHPNMKDGSGTVIVDDVGQVAVALTLYDALQNLTTLAPRFGRCSGSAFANQLASPACSGAHPGFLTGTSSSVVFEPGFLLTVPVTSNLTQYDGISVAGSTSVPGVTKDYLFRLEGSQVLEFDFTSDRFSVVGLVDEPEVDLSFVITENATSACSTQPCLDAGTTRTAGADPARSGFYRGDSAAWTVPPYEVEHVVAEVGYRSLWNKFAASYQRTFGYDAGSIDDAATIAWDRGWVTITTSGGIGEPPPPLYAWDLLHEVAQVRMHDGAIAEGAATTRFTLEQLPIGLTADQLVDKMRPTLQAKQAELSDRLIGTGGLAASGVDLYYVPATTGGGLFFFRAAGDAPSTYAYSKPGMFADAALATKLSTTAALPGTTDTAHEKLAVGAAGQTFYFRAPDAQGVEHTHRLVVVAVDATSVSVRIEEVSP